MTLVDLSTNLMPMISRTWRSFWAVRHGRRDAIRQYTEKGFDVNLRTSTGIPDDGRGAEQPEGNPETVYGRVAIPSTTRTTKGYSITLRADARHTQLAECTVPSSARTRRGQRDGASAWINVEEATEVTDWRFVLSVLGWRPARVGRRARRCARPARASSGAPDDLGPEYRVARAARACWAVSSRSSASQNHRLSEQKLPDQHAGVRRRQRAPVQQPTQVKRAPAAPGSPTDQLRGKHQTPTQATMGAGASAEGQNHESDALMAVHEAFHGKATASYLSKKL